MINLEWIKEEGKINENTYIIDPSPFGMKGSMACYSIVDSKIVLIDASEKYGARTVIKN